MGRHCIALDKFREKCEEIVVEMAGIHFGINIPKWREIHLSFVRFFSSRTSDQEIKNQNLKPAAAPTPTEVTPPPFQTNRLLELSQWKLIPEQSVW